MTIGERIKLRRKELHLTLKDIFAQEHIQIGNMSEMENNKYYPSAQNIIALSRVLHCSTDWLLNGEDFSENLISETNKFNALVCTSKEESDLIEMYRALDDRDKNDAFEILKLKYERSLNKKGFTYSHQESDTDSGDNTADGIA